MICCEDVTFSEMGEFKLIDLGVVIRVPKNHHSLLLPRSSTFKKYSILQANSIGLIDQDYCGENDFWMMPAVFLGKEEKKIKKGTRLCQFLLSETIKITSLEEFSPKEESRGGFGSTGA